MTSPLCTSLLEHDPLIAGLSRLLARCSIGQRSTTGRRSRSWRGRPAHPESAYLKAFLLRIREGLLYTTQLRRFLLRHPLLVIELGFRLVLDPNAPYGFDVERTLPCEFWLREKLRSFDPALLQALLQTTVRALQDEIPGLGETVAFDVKHIYAWVKENNARAYVPERYDKTKRLAGDPDCRLGVKRSTNKELPDGSTDEQKELIWGYGSGIAVSTHADYGTVVLAESTLPFNEGDITYFRPLYQRTVLALGQYPTNVTADAAYDAWYVYEAAARHGGIAAVPLNQKSKTPLIGSLTVLRAARLACPCIPPSSSTTPMAIVPNGSNVRCSFQRTQDRPATTNNSPKAKAVSKMSTGNWVANSVPPWIAQVRFSTPSTTNAPGVSASMLVPKSWVLSALECAMAARLPISTR